MIKFFVDSVRSTGYLIKVPNFPDDSQKDLAAVLSYLAGRTLTKEEIWKAMGLTRSTYYDQLEKGTLVTADNLRKAGENLGINRAELLTRYRLIDPTEITSLALDIGGSPPPLSSYPAPTEVVMPQAPPPLSPSPGRTGGVAHKEKKAKREKPATLSDSRPLADAPPL
jgi:hypothetical protein